jgi:nucleoside phosphorylase
LRRDIFLHFLNRDTREIFGVYQTLKNDSHGALMRRALNAAVALCENRCIAPPGFIVEDQIVFELAENQRAYLSEGLIQFPMRESNLAEFAEKKRIGYEPMRDRYSGLFNDTRIGFLGENATGIIGRRSRITESILQDWQGGAESGHKVWKPTMGVLMPAHVDLVAKIPVELNERGTALTWSAIAPQLPNEAKAASTELRDVLQHIYFQQYCSEFKLIALTAIPHILRDFLLPHDDLVYSYRRLSLFLDAFEVRELIFDAPAELIVALRRRPGFIGFMDAYADVAAKATSDTDLTFHAGRARDAVKYDWSTLRARRLSLFDVTQVEVSELASVIGEAADRLVHEHGLTTRGQAVPQPTRPKVKPIMITEPDLVLFVALEEELEILTRQLRLAKNPSTPEASGNVGGVAVDVVCPRNMGRVAAAVAVSNYLAKRGQPPKLILIVGIAGGFEENGSNVGHIVAVTKVVDLAVRKVIDDDEGPSPSFRREDYRMHDALTRVMHSHLFDMDQWANEACNLEWPKDRRPSIHSGPMASSDEVVSSKDWRHMMIQGQGGETKLLGVEMEAGGVCAAAERRRVPVCMLRAISDKADPSKADDRWRPLGMKTLASLIERLPLGEVLKNV